MAEADLWLRNRGPAARQTRRSAAYAGYCGIYVNRLGYADQAAELEDVFTEILIRAAG